MLLVNHKLTHWLAFLCLAQPTLSFPQAELLRKTLLISQSVKEGRRQGAWRWTHWYQGVTNSKKHFIITLQHINSLGPICAFWQLGTTSPRPLQAPCLPSHCTVHRWPWLRGQWERLEKRGQEPSPALQLFECWPALVICWGYGCCGRTAPQGSGQQRRDAARLLPV